MIVIINPITCACVNSRPKMLYSSVIRTISIVNLSMPFKTKYIQKSTPGIFIWSLMFHRNKKAITPNLLKNLFEEN